MEEGHEVKRERVVWNCARVYLVLQVVTSRFMGKINAHFR